MGTRRSVHGWAGTVISLLATRLNLLSVEVQLSKRMRPFKFQGYCLIRDYLKTLTYLCIS
jgi:uncharacterized membrane protein YqjE